MTLPEALGWVIVGDGIALFAVIITIACDVVVRWRA